MRTGNGGIIIGILRLLLCAMLIVQSGAAPVRAAVTDTVALSVTIDDAAPCPITSLNAETGSIEGSTGLTWIAPSENGLSGGKVAGYTVHAATFSVASLAGDATAWWYHPSVTAVLEIPAALVHDPGAVESNAALSLEPGVTYYFGIRSFDGASNWSGFDAGMYASSQTAAAALDLPPVIPTGFSAAVLSTHSVTLSWNDMSSSSGYADLEAYRLYRSTLPGLPSLYQTILSTTAVDGAVEPGTTYYYALGAVDRGPAVFVSALTGAVTVYMPYPVQPLPAPSGLHVVAVSSFTVSLAWDDMAQRPDHENFGSYQLVRQDAASGQENVTSLETPAFIDQSVVAGATYYYRVRSVTRAPQSLPGALSAAVTVVIDPPVITFVDLTVPRPPTGIKIKVTSASCEISWSRSEKNTDGTPYLDPMSYRIYSAGDVYGSWQLAAVVTDTRAETITWTGSRSPAATLFYKVRALDAYGNESADSMMCDTSAEQNIICVSKDSTITVKIPAAMADVLYRDNVFKDDIIILVDNLSETGVPGTVAACELSAVKASTDEKISGFKFTKPQAHISITYDVAQRAAAIANPLRTAAASADVGGSELSMFWHNGNEWVKLSSVIGAGTLSTVSSRLGKYMLKSSLRATSFTLTKVYPRIFTPNGDGLNDYVEFQFENPQDGNPYGMIYDMRGARVAELKKGNNYDSLIWDGRMSSGSVALPGAYVYQIEVTGAETKTINGVVILAK